MSWGTGLWGLSPWGSSGTPIPATTVLGIGKVDPWALDMIEVTFTSPVRNESGLQNKDNYTITPLDSGLPVTVLSVQTGNRVNPRRIFLVTTNPEVGKKYQVSVNSNIKLTDGSALDISARTGQFIARRTKTDSMVRSRPKMYDTRPNKALYRHLLNALSREDELIGGSRKDYLP